MPPLPNMKILPDGWQAHHRATIAATFRSTVRVVRLSDQQGTRNTTTGKTSFATPYIVYDGPARVQSRAGRSSAEVADRSVTVGSYLVVLPADAAEVKVHDLVEVGTVPDSPALDGLVLVVTDVPAADVAWQRNLGCDLREPTARG